MRDQNMETFVPAEANVESLWTRIYHLHPDVARVNT